MCTQKASWISRIQVNVIPQPSIRGIAKVYLKMPTKEEEQTFKPPRTKTKYWCLQKK